MPTNACVSHPHPLALNRLLFCSLLPAAPRPSQRAPTVGDDKLPALPPPQIPSCLSKYPPRSQSVWHSDSECDRGCTCVRPYVCVWLASQGFWQEADNRNTHFHLIGSSPHCQPSRGWWSWMVSKYFCQNFYARQTLWTDYSTHGRASVDLAFMSPCDSKSCRVKKTMLLLLPFKSQISFRLFSNEILWMQLNHSWLLLTAIDSSTISSTFI